MQGYQLLSSQRFLELFRKCTKNECSKAGKTVFNKIFTKQDITRKKNFRYARRVERVFIF